MSKDPAAVKPLRQLATVCNISESRARSAVDAAIEAGSDAGKARRIALDDLAKNGLAISKNPHAVALGRKGGKKGGLAKVRKGFAAMPAAEAKRIRALAAAARKAGLTLGTPVEVVEAVVKLKKLTGIARTRRSRMADHIHRRNQSLSESDIF